MNAGRTVFSQLIEFLPHQEFQKCVARYGGDRYLKNLSCWDQYLAMAFAQLTYRESLRDIEACLRSVGAASRAKARCGGHADLAGLPPRHNHGHPTRNQADGVGVPALPARLGLRQRVRGLAASRYDWPR